MSQLKVDVHTMATSYLFEHPSTATDILHIIPPRELAPEWWRHALAKLWQWLRATRENRAAVLSAARMEVGALRPRCGSGGGGGDGNPCTTAIASHVNVVLEDEGVAIPAFAAKIMGVKVENIDCF